MLDFTYELECQSKGFKDVCGIDEAGRGPAAGGVWAAAVCFKRDVDKSLFGALNDLHLMDRGHLLIVKYWVSYLTFLRLLIFEMGIIIASTSQQLFMRIK